jgi:hypothetical protein
MIGSEVQRYTIQKLNKPKMTSFMISTFTWLLVATCLVASDAANLNRESRWRILHPHKDNVAALPTEPINTEKLRREYKNR